MRLRRKAKVKRRRKGRVHVPLPLRFGDYKQAANRINYEVRHGTRPNPNRLPCSDCGQSFGDSGVAHVWAHADGWDPERPLDVLVLCQRCSRRRVIGRRTGRVDSTEQTMLPGLEE